MIKQLSKNLEVVHFYYVGLLILQKKLLPVSTNSWNKKQDYGWLKTIKDNVMY